MRPAQQQKSRDGRREQEADEGQGELLGEVAFGAAVQDREVAAHSLGDQPAGTGSMKDTGRRTAEPGGETAVGFGGEDRGRLRAPGAAERGPGRARAWAGTGHGRRRRGRRRPRRRSRGRVSRSRLKKSVTSRDRWSFW